MKAQIELSKFKDLVDDYVQEMKEISDSVEDEQDDNVETRRLNASAEISLNLSELFGKALTEFRENMRANVEKHAFNTFLSISNNRDNYVPVFHSTLHIFQQLVFWLYS